MKTNLFIPKKLKIGFQERTDTFTGKLAYVIYYDEKGKLRKEASWNSWCDKKIEPVEYDNNPMNGFVLNKGVHRYSDWGTGRHVIRIHDPRDFEFELTVDNLMGILTHSDVSKREITEQMVFAWNGTELVLLPVNSQAYQDSVVHTDKQNKKVSTKDLVPGRQYAKKKDDLVYMYIGFYPWFDILTEYDHMYRATGEHTSKTNAQVNKGKKHVFWDGANYVVPSVSTLSSEISEEIHVDFAQKCEDFFGTVNGQKIVGFRFDDAGTSPTPKSNEYYKQYISKRDDNSVYIVDHWNHNANTKNEYLTNFNRLEVIDGVFTDKRLCIIEYERRSIWNNATAKHLGTFVCDKDPTIHVKLILENGKETYYDRFN